MPAPDKRLWVRGMTVGPAPSSPAGRSPSASPGPDRAGDDGSAGDFIHPAWRLCHSPHTRSHDRSCPERTPLWERMTSSRRVASVAKTAEILWLLKNLLSLLVNGPGGGESWVSLPSTSEKHFGFHVGLALWQRDVAGPWVPTWMDGASIGLLPWRCPAKDTFGCKGVP